MSPCIITADDWATALPKRLASFVLLVSDGRRVRQSSGRMNEVEMKPCKVSVEIATSEGSRDTHLVVLTDHSSGVSESYLGDAMIPKSGCPNIKPVLVAFKELWGYFN